MLDNSDVHHHRHSKAAVGGVAAAAIGDPAVSCRSMPMHQGPHGGGPVIAIVEQTINNRTTKRRTNKDITDGLRSRTSVSESETEEEV